MLWTRSGLSSWDPWTEIERTQRDFERLFRFGRAGGEFPAVNVWAGEDDLILTAELPGVALEDLDVTVKDDTVTVRGERKTSDPDTKGAYLRRERGAGQFVRSFALPYAVEAGKAAAHYQNGILQVVMPRAEADKPKRIAVQTA